MQYETNTYEIMGWESSDVDRFDFGSLRQGQMRIIKLKNVYNSLIIGARGLECETNLSVASRAHFTRDRALIRLQTWIFI